MQDHIVTDHPRDRATPMRRPLRLLGIYAHPDDETLCVGGTLAKYASEGADILIVSATQGERGKIRDTHLATQETLGQRRVREFHHACKRLGVSQAICLDYGDGQLMSMDQSLLIAQLATIISTFRPDVVLTFGDDGAYGHPDHIAIGAATDEAVRQSSNPSPYTHQVGEGLGPHMPALYHSYFPQNPHLLFELLSGWLASRDTYFQSSPHFALQLKDFAHDLVMMGYSRDHMTVDEYPVGTPIIRQGAEPDSLYLILSGVAEVKYESQDGSLETRAELAPGSFFGEQGIALHQPRNAHVIAKTHLSCLIFSQEQPIVRTGSLMASTHPAGTVDTNATMSSAMVQLDVSAYVPQKVEALAAHRTQFSILPELLPEGLWQRLFAHEYFVRVNSGSEMASQSCSRLEPADCSNA